jgi:ATP/maltotriose-dependent transcriptional regulator MalT
MVSREIKSRTLLPGVNLARITPPTVPPHLIIRENLLQEFDTPVPYAIFVVAPSGYGKTTLAAQWAARNPKNSIWYTASKSDSPKVSLFHFIESFRSLFPGFAPWAESLINVELDVKEIVTRMSNEVSALATPINFITDAAENLSAEHTEMMELWATNAPTNLRTITTRSSVPAPLYARAATLNSIKVINASDLKLSQVQVEDLAGHYNVDLHASDVTQIVELAQGWPTGINIALKGLQEGKKLSTNDSFHDVSSMDSRTLVRSAINSLNSIEKEFLTSMALFEEVRPEYVRAMMGDSSARNTLRRMGAEGVFISEIGIDQSSFQINPIIRDVIIEDLRGDSSKFRDLCRKSAAALEESGQSLFAIELYMEAGEREIAKSLINSNTHKMIYSNNGDVLRRWRKVVAASLGLEFSGEILVDAYAAMVSADLDSFKAKLEELTLVARGTSDEMKISGDVGVMNCRVLFSEGRLSECIALALTLPQLTYTQETFSAAKILTGLRFASWSATLLEDMDSLLALQEIAENLDYPRDNLPLIGVSAIQAAVALGDGRLKDARDLAIYSLKTSQEYGYSGLVSPFDVTYVLAEVSREYCQDQEALEYCASVIEVAKKHELHPWVVALMSKQALIYSHMGDSSQALIILRQIRDYLARPFLHHEIHRVVDEHELFIRAAVRDSERLEELLFRMPKTTTIIAFTVAVMVSKNASANSSYLNKLPTRTLREKLNYEVIAAQSKLDKPTEAKAHIHSAIQLAMSQGHRRIFLSQQAPFKNLLLDIASDHPSIYIEQLASAVRESLRGGKDAQGVGLVNPLTKRELDILRRLTTGLPITQIAASLHISNNTIKTHLKNVYKKLEVDSRESAVTKGRELLLF